MIADFVHGEDRLDVYARFAHSDFDPDAHSDVDHEFTLSGMSFLDSNDDGRVGVGDAGVCVARGSLLIDFGAMGIPEGSDVAPTPGVLTISGVTELTASDFVA